MEVRTRAAVVLAFLLLEDDEENEGYQIERQYWVQPCLAKREQFGAFQQSFLVFEIRLKIRLLRNIFSNNRTKDKKQ